MKIHFILVCLFSLDAFAECPVDSVKKAEKFDSFEKISNKIIDEGCFSESVGASYGERYSEEYCGQYIRCSNMIEGQLGEIEGENVDSAPLSFILNQSEKIGDKLFKIQKKNLQTMAEMLAIVPADKLPVSSCPNINNLFKIPKEDIPEDALLKVSDIQKMKSDGLRKIGTCNFAKAKSCYGFDNVKNYDQLVNEAIKKIKSLCNKTLSFQDSYLGVSSDNKIAKGIVLMTDIDYDLNQGYNKYLRENSSLKLYTKDEERKHMITYFTVLEAVRCRSGAKFVETKHKPNTFGYFQTKRAGLYFMTENDAKKRNDSVVKSTERSFKVGKPNSSSLYSPSSNNQASASNIGSSTVLENRSVSSQQVSNNNQHLAPTSSQASTLQSSNQFVPENAATNFEPQVASQAPIRSPAQRESVADIQADTKAAASNVTASSVASSGQSLANSAKEEVSKLRTKINDLESKLNNRDKEAKTRTHEQGIDLPINNIASNEQKTQNVIVPNTNNGNFNKFDQTSDSFKEKNHSIAQVSGADIKRSSLTASDLSKLGSLVLFKVDGISDVKSDEAIFKRIMEDSKPFIIEDSKTGVAYQIVPILDKDGKVVIDEVTKKPKFEKIKVDLKKLARKAAEKGRSPASVDAATNLPDAKRQTEKYDPTRYYQMRDSLKGAISKP